MGDFILGIFLGSVVTSVFMFMWFEDFNQIYSTKKINPELKVTIQGSKSDTLFIYKELKIKN